MVKNDIIFQIFQKGVIDVKRIVCLAICLLMVFSLVACGGSSDNDSTSPSSNEEKTAVEENTAEPTEEAVVYAEDEVVNQFIADYNAITQSEFTDISKGNIRTKYFAYSYGYYCELLNSNATNKINVTINETNENADIGVSGMRDIFHDVAITIDLSLSDEEVYAHFDELASSEYMKEGDVLGSMVILYVPDKELSSGHSRGHIEISAQ